MEDRDLYGMKSTVTGRDRERREKFTNFMGEERHGIEAE